MRKPDSHRSASVIDLCRTFPARFGYQSDALHERHRRGLARANFTFPPAPKRGGGDPLLSACLNEADAGSGGGMLNLSEVRVQHPPTMMQDCSMVNAGMQRAEILQRCEAAPMDKRGELKAWMRAVMDRKDWSARHWAIKAGLAPTTVTRFLSRDDASFPTYDTLVKLVEHAPTDLPVPGLEPREPGAKGDIQLLKALPPDKRRIAANLIRDLAAGAQAVEGESPQRAPEQDRKHAGN